MHGVRSSFEHFLEQRIKEWHKLSHTPSGVFTQRRLNLLNFPFFGD